MKKALWIFAILITACLPARAQERLSFEMLEEFVDTLNAHMPMRVGLMMEINSLELTRSVFTWHSTMKDFGAMENQTSAGLKETLCKSLPVLIANSAEVEMLFQTVAGFDLSVKFVVRSADTGRTVTAVVSNAELRELLLQRSDPEALLQLIVANSEKTMPMSFGNGLTAVERTLSRGWAGIVYEVDESVLDFNQIELGQDAVRNNFVGIIKNKVDPGMSLEVQACVETGRGIVFIYRGSNSGRELRIAITAAQLRGLLDGK